MSMMQSNSGRYRITESGASRAGSDAVYLAVADTLIEATVLARRSAAGLHDTRRYEDLISVVDRVAPDAA